MENKNCQKKWGCDNLCSRKLFEAVEPVLKLNYYL